VITCDNVLVSIVVPVYNVKLYLSRCLESLVTQTHRTLEIILVNDGSTDGSEIICKEWVKRDDRIRLVEQENQGLGEARNKGLSVAQGQYLAYVDSDDWVQSDYIESMLFVAEKNQADLIVCNYQKVYGEHGKYVYKPEKMKLTPYCDLSVQADRSLLIYIGTLVWNKLYRREWMLEVGIKQPSGAVEDMCVSFVYAAKAKKIIHVNKILYNYYQREASLITGDKAFHHLLHALEIIKRNAQLYIDYDDFAYEINKIMSDGIVYYDHLNKDKSDCRLQVNILKQRFNELCEWKSPTESEVLFGNAIAFGSFNLRSVVKELCYFIPDYYGFSSLIAAVGTKEYDVNIKMTNSFRKEALQKELQKTFRKNIRNTKVLFIDFMEERFGILETMQWGTITNSLALKEWKDEEFSVKTTMPLEDKDYMECWKESVACFKRLIQEVNPRVKMVLVRSRLAEYYGHFGKEIEYPNKKDIRMVNHQLAAMEKYYLEAFPHTIAIDIPAGLCYTDVDYEYGCHPWHLNAFYYKEMAKTVRQLLL